MKGNSRSGGLKRFDIRVGFRPSFNNQHPRSHHKGANASCGKVGFELATDGIQFYVFAN